MRRVPHARLCVHFCGSMFLLESAVAVSVIDRRELQTVRPGGAHADAPNTENDSGSDHGESGVGRRLFVS